MCWVLDGVEGGGPCILKRCYAGLVLGLRLVLGFGVGSRSGKKRSGCP